MPSKWYYEKGGVRKGPVTSEDIRRMVANGTLLPTDLLWKEGMKDWMPAGKSSNLFPAADALPSPQATSPPGKQKARSRSGVLGIAVAIGGLAIGATGLTAFFLQSRVKQPENVSVRSVTSEAQGTDAGARTAVAPAVATDNSNTPEPTESGPSVETRPDRVDTDLASLSAAQAADFVSQNPAWGISLNALETLSLPAAKELRKYGGLWISFRKPIRIEPDAAAQLCRFKGELGMMGLTQVTPEFCRLFTEHQGVLNLSKVTAIDDAVASALSERHGGLDVSGLQSVSESQLELLLQVRGPLEVGGVGQLKGYKWTESLKGRAGRTVLKGNTDVRSMGGFGYQGFRHHEASLFLENVHFVPDELARAIADKPGHISFAEDASMSPAAKAILDNRNNLVDLVVVEHLDNRLAEGIATRARMAREATQKPVEVNLPRVSELNLTFKVMDELSSFSGTLLLGIRHLSDYDAEVLGASHLSEICLPALENTSIRALCSLAKAKRMTLNLPTLLSLSDEFTHALEAHEGWLILKGLQSITDSQVESLARKRGDLELPENLTLSERQRAILAARKKVDVLDGCWWRDKR